MGKKDLIVIEKKDTPAIFVENGLDPFIEKIRVEVIGIVPILDTAKGRAEIVSRSGFVSSQKVALLNHGKKLLKNIKAKIKPASDEIKRAEGILNALRDEIRKPLDEWQAEKNRKDKESADILEKRQLALAKLRGFKTNHEDSKNLSAAIDKVENWDISSDAYGENKETAESVKTEKLADLKSRMELVQGQEMLKADKIALDKKLAALQRKQEQTEARAKIESNEILAAQKELKIKKGESLERLVDEIRTCADIKRLEAIVVNGFFGDRKDEAAKLKENRIAELKNAAESKRVDAIKQRIRDIKHCGLGYIPTQTSQTIQRGINIIKSLIVDEFFEEFQEKAIGLKSNIKDSLESALKECQDKEKKAEEKKEEKRKADIDKLINSIEDCDFHKLGALPSSVAVQKMIAKLESVNVDCRFAEFEKQAHKSKKLRIKELQEHLEIIKTSEADEKRKADEKHRANIEKESIAGLVKLKCNAKLAKKIVDAVKSGNIENLNINY